VLCMKKHVLELHCRCGSVTCTVVSERAILGSAREGCVSGVRGTLGWGLEAARFLGWSQRFCW
jgi:hypothetical protein